MKKINIILLIILIIVIIIAGILLIHKPNSKIIYPITDSSSAVNFAKQDKDFMDNYNSYNKLNGVGVDARIDEETNLWRVEIAPIHSNDIGYGMYFTKEGAIKKRFKITIGGEIDA